MNLISINVIETRMNVYETIKIKNIIRKKCLLVRVRNINDILICSECYFHWGDQSKND